MAPAWRIQIRLASLGFVERLPTNLEIGLAPKIACVFISIAQKFAKATHCYH